MFKKILTWRISIKRFIRVLGILVLSAITCIILPYTLVEQNASLIFVNQWGKSGPHFEVYNETFWTKKDIKKILVWTTFFGQTWFEKLFSGPLKNCPFNCTVTKDKNEIYTSDVVIFHLMDLTIWTQMPTYRSREQIWLLFGAETPVYTDIYSAYLRRWRRKFNWTMTYRKDSTIYSPYGSYKNWTISQKQNINMEDLVNVSKTKTKLIMALASNCVDDAQRYKLIYSLKKHLDIDFYGACGNLKCPLVNPKCEKEFQNYKFILALENSHCRDYVTEKFWRALTLNVVPVVNWKEAQKGYREFAPPNSYIDIDDFDDLETLAAYIKKLDKNDTLYNSYFEWKKNYTVEGQTIGIAHKSCDLCKALHFPRKAQTLIDPAKWIDDDVCERWSVS